MSEGSKSTGLVGKISWALFKAPIAFLSAEYKAVGAVLVALLVAVAIGQIGNKIFEIEPLEQNAYPIHVEGAVVAGDGESAGGTQAGPEPIGPLLATADVVAGEQVAAKCAGCHTFNEGSGVRVGPNLYSIVGRGVASQGDFAYSDALKDAGGDWDYETLNAFLENPNGAVPGTGMGFPGVKSTGERANLIAYLRSLSSDPVALPEGRAVPEPEPEPEPVEEEAAAPEPSGVAALVAAADPDAGKNAAGVCMGCHTFDKGGPTRVGPNLYGIVGDDIASRDGFAYSDALTGLEGAWTYDALDAFLADPRGVAQGTKMGFGGVRSEDDRAAIIAFIRGLDDSPEPLP